MTWPIISIYAYLDVQSSEIADLVREVALIVDRAWWDLIGTDDTVGQRDAMIVFTEGGRLVNDTSTIGIFDIGVDKHSESLVFELQEVSKKLARKSKHTFSVKYSNKGTYLQPFMSDPWNWANFLNLAFFGSL